jgi:hypothetical protein
MEFFGVCPACVRQPRQFRIGGPTKSQTRRRRKTCQPN